jgi:hypothetical protein
MDLNDELMRPAGEKAADRGEGSRGLGETALRMYLRANAYRFQWHVEQGRLMPGVRLDDRDALFDLMEGRR